MPAQPSLLLYSTLTMLGIKILYYIYQCACIWLCWLSWVWFSTFSAMHPTELGLNLMKYEYISSNLFGILVTVDNADLQNDIVIRTTRFGTLLILIQKVQVFRQHVSFIALEQPTSIQSLVWALCCFFRDFVYLLQRSAPRFGSPVTEDEFCNMEMASVQGTRTISWNHQQFL